MDPQQLQGKVEAFALRLLDEANGDPVRALGLLVLVLDGSDVTSGEHLQRLVLEVRKILIPEQFDVEKPIRHLAGDVSWEGVQHCLRCAKVLARRHHDGDASFKVGYVYEFGSRFTSDHHGDFQSCV